MSAGYLFVRHKVADFSAWYKGYKAPEAVRLHQQYGVVGGEVFQSADDPNDITIKTEFPSVEMARKYANSDELKTAMQRIGVAGTPSIWFAMKK